MNRINFFKNKNGCGSGIVRTGPDSFNLTQIGTYQIMFQVKLFKT